MTDETLLPPVPREHGLNIFLTELAQEMREEDVEAMKFIIKGKVHYQHFLLVFYLQALI